MDWSAADRIAMVNVLATGKTYYVVPFAGDPFSGGTELPLARQAMTFPAAVGTPVLTQPAKLTWPPIATNQPDATHLGFFDALTGGNLRAAKELVAHKPMPAGTICSVNAGVITVTQN